MGRTAKTNGKWYFPRSIIDNNGYVTDSWAPTTGMPPPVGLGAGGSVGALSQLHHPK